MNSTMSKNTHAISREDIDMILEAKKTHTWDDFYELLHLERQLGDTSCTRAATVALELLTPHIMSLPYKSNRTDSESGQDLLSEAYLTITKRIPGYDESRCKFETYIGQWLVGVAREIRSGGMSYYETKEKNYKVVSIEAMAYKQMGAGNSSYEFEVVDEHSAVEDIVEKHEVEKSNALLGRILNNITNENRYSNRRRMFENAVIYEKFLGGHENLSLPMQKKLEEILGDDDLAKEMEA